MCQSVVPAVESCVAVTPPALTTHHTSVSSQTVRSPFGGHTQPQEGHEEGLEADGRMNVKEGRNQTTVRNSFVYRTYNHLSPAVLLPALTLLSSRDPADPLLGSALPGVPGIASRVPLPDGCAALLPFAALASVAGPPAPPFAVAACAPPLSGCRGGGDFRPEPPLHVVASASRGRGGAEKRGSRGVVDTMS